MSTLTDLLAEHTDLAGGAVEHLQRVVAEWQLIADLSFADLLMYVRSDVDDLICVAQCRPNTATTVFGDDQVTSRIDESTREHRASNPAVRRAFSAPRLHRDDHEVAVGTVMIRRDAVPVTVGGAVVAVISRAVTVTDRSASPMERAYRDCASVLCEMIVEGIYPQDEGNPQGLSTPRAGDGFIRLDSSGVVMFASPNALSAVHRMGWQRELRGEPLAHIFAESVEDRFGADDVRSAIDNAVGGHTGMRIEVDARRASVLVRAVPLVRHSTPTGAVVLVREVTELKRRDRALISKDATIREIHHRVKNNLQSVSALLRLQARRTSNGEARGALTEAVRRVAAIAMVHELLSGSVDEQVDLDVVVDQLVPVMADVASGDTLATVRRAGHLGVLASELAMPMVMVLTELIQNAVEHGFADGSSGEVVIDANRTTRRLQVIVHDNGIGLPPEFDPSTSDRLGLQIVYTLVRMDLRGELAFSRSPGGGATATLTVPLHTPTAFT